MNSKRLSKCQIERLVTLMEFYRGKSIKKSDIDSSEEGSNDIWSAIATELNAMDGASKSSEKWKKTWSDLKNKVRDRSSRVQQLSRRAGGPGPSHGFTLIEERVMTLMESGRKDDTAKEIYDPEVNLLEDSEVTIKMEYPDQETVLPGHPLSKEATEMENPECSEVSEPQASLTLVEVKKEFYEPLPQKELPVTNTVCRVTTAFETNTAAVDRHAAARSEPQAPLTLVEAKKDFYEPVSQKELPVTDTVHRVTTAFETNTAAVDRQAAALERQTAVLESVKDVLKLQAEALVKVAAAFEKYHKF